MGTHTILPQRTIRSQPIQQIPVEQNERIRQAILQPDLFCSYFLNMDLWSKQRNIIRALMTHDKIAVKSCHSSGKTAIAARAVIWFLARYKESTVVTTAPTWGQVERQLWGEIHMALAGSRYGAMLRRDKSVQILKTELRLEPGRYAYGLSTSVTNQDEGVKFQGIHNKNVLIILDEAPGVDPKIWGAIEGNRAGGNVKILAIGNPTIASGPFHDAFIKNRENWYVDTISAFDTPNFDFIPKELSLEQKLAYLVNNVSEEELDNNPRPYLTTRKWVKERFFEWGLGHPLFSSRVLGEFPEQSDNALLSLAWLEEASRRELPGEGKVCAGIDVAGPGESETSLTIRRGPRILVHTQWPISDPRGEIVAILNDFKNELDVVNVDAVGIGWYLYKHLEELKFPAVPFIAQSPSNDNEKYRSAKDEAYWGLRQRFQAGDICGLTDETTIGQLAGIQYKHNSRGQIEIESKEQAAKRGVDSPDRAESVMLAFAGQNLIFGVNEIYKQEIQMENIQKVQLAELIKPVISDKQVTCERCGAKCVIPYQTGFRCNQCAHQWTPNKPQPLRPVGGRSEDMMKIGRRVRLED